MPTESTKPMSVKITIFLFGLLAFSSWAALGSSEPGTSDTFVALLRAIPANFAFICLLSNTKAGRVVAIALFLLLCIAGVFGLLAAFQSFSSAPWLALAAAALSVGIFVLAGLYTFGVTTRAYYSAVFALNHDSRRPP